MKTFLVSEEIMQKVLSFMLDAQTSWPVKHSLDLFERLRKTPIQEEIKTNGTVTDGSKTQA